jgi:hypothetical protein
MSISTSEATMIFGAEVGFFVLGLWGLIRRNAEPNPKAKYVVQGWPRRLICFLFMLPWPLSFAAGMIVGAWWVAQGKDIKDTSFRSMATGIDLSALLLCVGAASIIGRVYRVPVATYRGETDLLSGLVAVPTWNVRNVLLKMAVGASLAMAIGAIAILSQARSATVHSSAVGLVVVAVIGALIGCFLALGDHVRDCRSRGLRVNPVLKAYFAWGIGSVILWIATALVAAIGGLFVYFYYSVSSLAGR